MEIRRIHDNAKYSNEAQKHVVQNIELCFVPGFHFALISYALGSKSTHTGLKLIIQMNRTQKGLVCTTLEVHDKALLGFKCIRSVPQCRTRGLKINHI